MKIAIATNNPNKLREIRAILGGFFDEALSLSDLGIDSLQTHPFNVRLKHIGHHLGTLPLVILPKSVYELNGIIIFLKLLCKNRVRGRSLVGPEMGGDGILHTLEGTVGQVFLLHMPGQDRTESFLSQCRGIELIQELGTQWIGRTHRHSSFSFHISQRNR